jgi:hypothetical protein
MTAEPVIRTIGATPNEPRGARNWDAQFAPQPCIRLDPPGIRTMKQQMRFGSETPRRRTHSRYGMQAMRLLGRRHLGTGWRIM